MGGMTYGKLAVYPCLLAFNLKKSTEYPKTNGRTMSVIRFSLSLYELPYI